MLDYRTSTSEIVEAGRASDMAVVERAPPFSGRPVFVIVGMHRSGASVLAKMLQILGVDMGGTYADGTEPNWERPEIVAFNDRLLEIIGRPLASPVHALPFPAGWWGDPRVMALKREVQSYLRSALEDRYGSWGFKDLRVTRLLPFWTQVFEEMGLQPNYLWTVRDPADCAASAVASGLAVSPEIAEAMWFIYNADVHKFVGEEAVSVVDYAAWSEDPATIVDKLLGRLPLNWRGSHGELLECVRAIASTRPTSVAAPSSIHAPLVHTFYKAIRDPDRSETSLRYRHSVAQAVDILRTLVAPYAALVKGADPVCALPAAPQAAQLSPCMDDTVAAALARAAEAEAASRVTQERLNSEIEARTAENSWLQQQFLDSKRALAEREEPLRRDNARLESEMARLRTEMEAGAAEQRAALRKIDELHAAAERQRRLAKEELEQVRKDLQLQKTANEKYLSRIYELKAMRKTEAGSSPGLSPA